MKKITIILLCFSWLYANAQKTIDVTTGNVSAMSPSFFGVVGGEPFVFAKFSRIIEGTPYFREDWIKGTVVVGEQQQYANVLLKLDLLDNEVHFQNAKGEEMVAFTPIQRIMLFDTSAQQVFTFVNVSTIQSDSRIKGWYELLSEGKATLYKQYRKQIREDRPYGSATIEQRVITAPHYFLYSGGKFTELKKLKDLPPLLTDKSDELTKFSKNVQGKPEDQMMQTINYYNGL